MAAVRVVVALWLWAGCTTTVLSETGGGHPMVALGWFEHDSGTYQEQRAAAELSDELHAELSQWDDFQVVGRQHLEFVYREMWLAPMVGSRQRDLLKAARQANADWILLGEVREGGADGHVLVLEVVHAGEADVLAAVSIPALEDGDARSREGAQFDLPLVAEQVHSVLTDALWQWERNQGSFLVITPVFMESISPTGRLDGMPGDFLKQLRQQSETDAGLRMVTFPAIGVPRDRVGPALDGVIQWPRDATPGGTPLFLWGSFEESTMDGAAADQAMVDASVWLWDGTGEPVEVRDEALVSESGPLVERLIGAVLDGATGLRQGPRATPEGLGELANAHLERGDRRMEEAQTAGRTLPPGDERVAKLGRQALGQHLLAGFLKPDDPGIQRRLMLAKAVFHHLGPAEDHRSSFPATWELNRVRAGFESRFPETVEPGDVLGSVGIAQLLIHDRTFLDIPRGYPRELRQFYSQRVQRQHVERLSRLNPGLFDANTNIAGFAMQGQEMLADPEDRALLIELLWPSFVAHRAAFRENVQESERWHTTLAEVFGRVGRPETAEALLALPIPSPGSGRRIGEPRFPADLRFEVRRVNLLPPLLDVTPVMLGETGGGRAVVTSLLFDGETLLAGIDRGQIRTWSGDHQERRESFHGSRTFLAARRENADGSRLERLRESPSTITSMVVAGDHLWLGTRVHGVVQLERVDHGLIREWTTADGLATDLVRALAWRNDRLIVAGGYDGAGRLSAITPGGDAAETLPAPRPVMIEGDADAEEPPGVVRRITRADDRGVLVTGRPHAWLTTDGWDGEALTDLGAKALTGTRRHGPDAHAGHVFTVVPDQRAAGGWWLGTSGGLAWASADGTEIRQWSPPRGAYMFEQRGWVPYMRQSGRLKELFETRTRLVGAVINMAVDGDFLFAVATSAFDRFLESELEGDHLMVLHVPSNRWVGRVKLPGIPTAMAQDGTRLWIGMLGDQHLVMEFMKEDLTGSPENEWVDDLPDEDEVRAARSALTRSEQASYAFFERDYGTVARLLADVPTEDLTLGERFLLAFSFDAAGLNRPDEARQHLEMILQMEPHSHWRHEAEQALNSLEPAAARD